MTRLLRLTARLLRWLPNRRGPRLHRRPKQTAAAEQFVPAARGGPHRIGDLDTLRAWQAAADRHAAGITGRRRHPALYDWHRQGDLPAAGEQGR